MDRRFSTAFLHVRNRTLLGRVLLPFSLRHRLILEAMDHPLLTEGKQIKPDDLLIAAIVLSGDSTEDCLKEPTIMDFFRSWLLNHSEEYFLYCWEGMKVHLQEGSSYPLIFQKEQEKDGARGLDWRCMILAILVKHGLDHERVLSMPECQAVWLYTALAIAEGGKVDVMSTDLEEELAALG